MLLDSSSPWFPYSPNVTVSVFVFLASSLPVLFHSHVLSSSNTTSLLTNIHCYLGSNSLYALEPGSVPRCTRVRDLLSTFLKLFDSILACTIHPNTRRCWILGFFSWTLHTGFDCSMFSSLIGLWDRLSVLPLLPIGSLALACELRCSLSSLTRFGYVSLLLRSVMACMGRLGVFVCLILRRNLETLSLWTLPLYLFSMS